MQVGTKSVGGQCSLGSKQCQYFPFTAETEESVPPKPVGLGSSGLWKVLLQGALLVSYACKETHFGAEAREWENVFKTSPYGNSGYYLFLVV